MSRHRPRSPGSGVSAISGWAIFRVQESLVSEEIVHLDLDTPVRSQWRRTQPGEQESLEVDAARCSRRARAREQPGHGRNLLQVGRGQLGAVSMLKPGGSPRGGGKGEC